MSKESTPVMEQGISETNISKGPAWGRIGKVILVEDVNMFGREVAIKRFSNDDLNRLGISGDIGKKDFEKKILAETKTISEIKHPNIIDIYFAGTYQDGFQIVMELIHGLNLKEKVEQDGRFDSEEIARIGVQLCDGLTHLHEKDIIHKNIKPESIMITGEGVPKFVGFGPVPGKETENLLAGAPVEVLSYLSPEQQKNHERADIRSDIYSLAATLFFAATGQAPSDPGRSELPEILKEPILKALNDNPEDRFQNARQFGEALESAFISKRQEKIISEGNGDFPCYDCEQPVPYTAAFCPSCGTEIQGVWRAKEKLYRETIRDVDVLCENGEFSEALKMLEEQTKAFSHSHFEHLRAEVDLKKKWTRDEWDKADTKKNALQSKIKKAQKHAAHLEFEIALEIANDLIKLKEPYFQSICKDAEKIVDDIKRIQNEDDGFRNELEKLKNDAENMFVRGEYAIAEKQVDDFVLRCDRKLHPETHSKALEFRERIQHEWEEAETKKKGLEKKIDEAQNALADLDLETSGEIALSLAKTEGGYFRSIAEDAKRILDKIQKIRETRQKYDDMVILAEKYALENDFSTAFSLLDEILSDKDDAYSSQRENAQDVLDNIREKKNRYLTDLRGIFQEKNEKASGDLLHSGKILKEIIENRDPELDSYRKTAKNILKKRNILFFLTGGVILAAIIGIFIITVFTNRAPVDEEVFIFSHRANFRSGPDTRFEVVASIKNDDKLTLIRKGIELSPDLHPWVRVYIPEMKQTGYLSAKLLVDKKGSILFREAVVYKTPASIRKEANPEAEVIGKFEAEEPIHILKWQLDKNGQIWYGIERNAVSGWVGASDVRLLGGNGK